MTTQQQPPRPAYSSRAAQSRPRSQRHLMVPGQPRPQRPDPMDINRVQRWVMSTLVVLTVEHLALGFVVAAAYVDPSRLDARIGLLVIAGLFGVLAVAAALLIHGRRPVSPWLLLGTLPAVFGVWWIFGR